jgi:FkbM family methyltransferase
VKSQTKVVEGFLFPSWDRYCSAAVFKERHKIDAIVKLCKGRGAAIQAGGNVGVFPAKLASMFERVYTFEPDPENFACLKENIQPYENVLFHNLGLGDKEVNGRMTRPHRGNCGAVVVEEMPRGEVRVIKLDDIIMDFEQIDLIYLDIEGYEHKALQGASKIIERCKPVLAIENKGLIPEYKNTGFDGSDEFREWVCGLGYKHHSRMMRDDVFVPIDET